MTGNKRTLIIWEVCYPVVVYLVVFNMAFYILGSLIGIQASRYMLVQAMAELICVPLVLFFYRRAPLYILNGEGSKTEMAKSIFLAVCAGIAGNVLIALTDLKTTSEAFNEVNELFYGGSLWMQILAAGILAPVVEEILYRGVVYGRLKAVCSTGTAMILSSVIFGVMHFNVVQAVYGILMGLVFVWLVEYTGKLLTGCLCHMAVNVVSLVTSKLGIAAKVFGNTGLSICVLAVLLLAAIPVCLGMKRKYRNRKRD